MEEKAKIERAKKLIEDTVSNHPRVAVACSFGKDSMVTVHLAREVAPKIKIFSVMTQYKPRETLDYLRLMNKEMNLGVTVYMVADSIPEVLRDDSIKVVLLPTKEFNEKRLKLGPKLGKSSMK